MFHREQRRAGTGGDADLVVDVLDVVLDGIVRDVELRQGGQRLSSLNTRHASLEDVFVTLTGRHLRDGGTTP